MTTQKISITLRGGAFDRQLLELVFDVEPDDVWPPSMIQVDGYEARWTYARTPGERADNGDHVFQFTHRERADMIGDFSVPPQGGRAAQVRDRS